MNQLLRPPVLNLLTHRKKYVHMLKKKSNNNKKKSSTILPPQEKKDPYNTPDGGPGKLILFDNIDFS